MVCTHFLHSTPDFDFVCFPRYAWPFPTTRSSSGDCGWTICPSSAKDPSGSLLFPPVSPWNCIGSLDPIVSSISSAVGPSVTGTSSVMIISPTCGSCGFEDSSPSARGNFASSSACANSRSNRSTSSSSCVRRTFLKPSGSHFSVSPPPTKQKIVSCCPCGFRQ